MRRRVMVAGVMAVVIVAAAGCGRSAPDDDLLPGHTRPLLKHDWAHPRDLQFAASRFTAPDPRNASIATASGLRAFVIAADDEPVVQMTAAVPLGRTVERDGEAGGSELLVRLLTDRVRQRLGSTFTGRVQVDQDVDLTRVSLQMLRDEWRAGLTGLVGALRQFEPGAQDARAIAAYRTGGGYVRRTRGIGGAGFRPAIELARMVAKHPVAPADAGQGVALTALRALAARSLAPQAVVLGIGGDVPRAEVERELQTLTSGWQVSPVPAGTAPAGAAPAGAAPGGDAPGTSASTSEPSPDRVKTIDEPGFTTWIALGHAVPQLAPADEAAVAVMTEILNIRLNIAIREMRGLANQAVLQMPATTRNGALLHVRTGGRPESVGPLLHYSREELSRIRETQGRPTADELEQAKGGLVLAKWQGALDGPRAASATYAIETVRYGSLDRLRGWPDAVRAVTADQVEQAAARYVQPDRLATVVIGQLDAARKARHPRWPFALDDVLARR